MMNGFGGSGVLRARNWNIWLLVYCLSTAALIQLLGSGHEKPSASA